MALTIEELKYGAEVGDLGVDAVRAVCAEALANREAQPDGVQHLKNVQELYHRQEERLFALAQRIKGASFDKYSHTTAQAIDVLEREIFGDDGDACRAAMLGNAK